MVFHVLLGLGITAAIGLIVGPRISMKTTRAPARALAPAPAAPALFPNLIENGDFEAYFPQSRPRQWVLDPDVLFLWDKFSRGPGDRSLFIDASQIAGILAPQKSRVVAPPLAKDGTQAPPPVPHAALRYPLPDLRPGASYILSFWIARDRNIDGSYPTAVLAGRAFRLSDFWTSGRWQKISLVVTLPRLIPLNQRRLELLIPAGGYRLWIDDLVLRRIAPEAQIVREPSAASRANAPNDTLTRPESASPKANARAVDREREGPTLTWALPSTDRLLDIRIVLSRDAHGRTDVHEFWTNNTAGENLSLPPPSWTLAGDPDYSAGMTALIVPVEKTVSDPLQTTQLPTDERKIDPSAEGADLFNIRLDDLSAVLPSGRWHARIEAYQYRTLLAASKAVALKIAAENRTLLDSDLSSPALPQRESATTPPIQSKTENAALPSRFRSDNKSILDSFPIGIFGARLEDFASLHEAGFDSVFFSARNAAELARALSEAARLGLALLLPPSDGELLAALPDLPASPSSAAPLFFYLADEPEGRSQSPKLLSKSRAALRRLGFPQPGVIALCRSWRAPDYASAVDIFMSDPYPVPFEPLSWLSECLDEIGRTIGSDSSKRVWAVIQAFPWRTVSNQIPAGLGRAPTPAELKALTRLALLHGADGLFFHALQSGDFRLRDDKPLWQAVKEAIAEARRLKPVLDGPDFFPAPARSSLPSSAPAQTPVPVLDCLTRDAYGLPAVHFAVKRSPADDSPVVLALNTLDRPVQATLRLPGRTSPISISLGPLELKILKGVRGP